MALITRSARVAPYIMPATAGAGAGPRALPDEVLAKIGEYRFHKPLTGIISAVTIDPSFASPALVREVSKVWNSIGLSLLENEWKSLLANSPPGFVDIRKTMTEIQSTHRQDPLDHTNKYVHMFRKLMSVFKRSGIDIRPGDHLLTTVAQYWQLQQRLNDQDLCKCWPAMREALRENEWFCCFSSVPRVDADAKTIRAYLRSEKGKSLIKSVSYLNLKGLGLLQIPSELALFSNIETLDLSNNRISRAEDKTFFTSSDVLSRECAFMHLRELKLSGNPIDLEGIPSIHCFPKLNFLELRYIPTLTSLKWIDTEKPRAEALTICLTGSPICDFIGDKALITRYGSLDIEEGAAPNEVKATYDSLKTMKNYEARSPLGKLYQSIIFQGIDDREVKRLFSELSAADKRLIYVAMRGLSTFVVDEDRIFDDMNTLRQSVKEAIIYKDYMFRGASPLNSGRIDIHNQGLWRRAVERAHGRHEMIELSSTYFLTSLADALHTISSDVFVAL